MFDDVVWHITEFQAHELRPCHGGIEVEILYVNCHEPSPDGGDNTVEKDLGGKHICSGGAAVPGKIDAVATNCESNAVGVILFGTKIGHNPTICDIAPAVGGDVRFADENDSIGAFYCSR